jgi:hypothetical protein
MLATCAAALFVVCVAVLVLATAAGAQTAVVCPEGPPTGTTGDDALHELRELRREQAQSCKALVDRLATNSDRADVAGDDIQDSIVISRGLQVGRDSENPSYVLPAGATGPTGATGAQEVTLSADTRGYLDTNGEASRSDVWFLMGMLASAPFGFFFLRIVLP